MLSGGGWIEAGATILIVVLGSGVSGLAAFYALRSRQDVSEAKAVEKDVAHRELHQMLSKACEDRHRKLDDSIEQLFALQRDTNEKVSLIYGHMKIGQRRRG